MSFLGSAILSESNFLPHHLSGKMYSTLSITIFSLQSFSSETEIGVMQATNKSNSNDLRRFLQPYALIFHLHDGPGPPLKMKSTI